MPKIDTLFAWVMADTDADDEGVPAISRRIDSTHMMMMPLIGADFERAKCLRSHAQYFANMRGAPIKLIRSTGIEIVEILQPEKKHDPTHTD